MTYLILARHGETDWAHEGRIQGHAQIELNQAGINQAITLANRLRFIKIDRIYSSDLRRALQTAQIVADEKKIPIQRLVSLRERDYGWRQGKTWSEAYLEGAIVPAADIKPPALPEGESPEHFRKRIVDQIALICAENFDKVSLVITHAGAIDVILQQSLNISKVSSRGIKIDFCIPFLFAFDLETLQLRCWDTAESCLAQADCILHQQSRAIGKC